MAPLPARIAPRARGAPAGGPCLALLIALAASCSEPVPSPVVRLLDVARDPARCRYQARPEPESSPTILGTGLEWEALPSSARERREDVRALFREHAARGPAGELVMAAAPGA
jgi:hypothetical protein